MDALCFRVSSDRQTTENQFDDLVRIAEQNDSTRDWHEFRDDLAPCILASAEQRIGPSGVTTAYRVVPAGCSS
jgi:hypothetical protein